MKRRGCREGRAGREEAHVAQLCVEVLVEQDVARLDVAVQHDALPLGGGVQEVERARGGAHDLQVRGEVRREEER